MTRTVTAMFDDRAQAEAARDRLAADRFDPSAIRLIDPAAPEPAGDQGGFWSSLVDMFMPDEDRHFYGEGLSRGHVMLAADVPEDRAAAACRIVEGTGCVDLEERARDWAAQGWRGRFAGSDAQAGAFGRYDGGTARVRAYRPD